jgi:hypothetical protein
MNVPEQCRTGSVPSDHCEQVLRAGFGPPSLHVVDELGDGRRDVAAQHVNSPEGRDGRGELIWCPKVGAKRRLALGNEALR